MRTGRGGGADLRSVHRRRVTAGVVASTVLMSSGALVIFPVLPALQERLGMSTADIGFVAAGGFGASLVAELLVAPLADRGRGRQLGIVGVLLMSAGLAASALATESWHLVAGRGIDGFGFGMFMAGASALLVRADPDRSGESLGRLGAAELAGVSLGPLASGLAIAIATPSTILTWSAVVVLIAIVPVALTFREPPASLRAATGTADDGDGTADADAGEADAGEADAGEADAGEADAGEAARATGTVTLNTATMSFPPALGSTAQDRPPLISLDLLRSPRVIAVLLLYGAVMIPTGAYDGIWPRFMTDIGASELLTALSYTLFAVPYILLAGWAGRLADRIGGTVAFARGLIVLVPIVALYGVIGDPWVATGMGFLESSGQALAFIGAAAAMAQTVPAARAGASQGLLRAFGLLTATIAAALSGIAYERGGPLALFGGTAIAVVLMAVAGLILVRWASSRR